MNRNVLLALTGHQDPVGPLAEELIELGGLREPLLDALEERGINVFKLEVGKCYYIETVTKYWVGRVGAITNTEITLEEAAWVDETGRFSDFLRTGYAETVEPVPEEMSTRIPTGMVTDVIDWPHRLLRRVV